MACADQQQLFLAPNFQPSQLQAQLASSRVHRPALTQGVVLLAACRLV
jgi:hypothetical protein